MAFGVLIIEDDVLHLELLCEILEQEGYFVRVAATVGEALECLREQCPHVIICDYHLAEATADECLDLFAQRGLCDGTPVVLLTATRLSLIPDRHRYDAIIEKPFEIDALLREMRRVREESERGGGERGE